MERQALIDMLNKDLADEHISVIRYLVHAYQSGEDTPLGSMLLSTAREEMWHMDWLADLIGEMGAEPNMKPGIYPHDPTSNASLLRSYMAWEENLVTAYVKQANQVDDPEIKRVLLQQSDESNVHRQRFAAMLEKLGPEGETPLVYADSGEFSPQLISRMQHEMTDEYKLVLQHLRDAFVFEDHCPVSSELELTAMRHMKHLSHFAEELAEAGHEPQFLPLPVKTEPSVASALKLNLQLTHEARDSFADLIRNPELAEHPGLKVEVANMISQEEFLGARVHDLLESVEKTGEVAERGPEAESQTAPAAHAQGPLNQFTVGSLIEKK